MLAIVPPLALPRMAFSRPCTVTAGAPYRSTITCWVNTTPRSKGMESNPHAWRMRAPDASASDWCASIMRRIHCSSPVRSQ